MSVAPTRAPETASSVRPSGLPRRSRSSAAGRLTLQRRRPLREAILYSFARVLSYAGRVTRASQEEPSVRVHEYRKSIRRARALLALLRPALGKKAERAFQDELQAAFRETSVLRDADILLAALRSLPHGLPAKDRVEEALQAELSARRVGEETDVLTRGVRRLKPLPAALGVILPSLYSTRDLERGLARSYFRARDALAQARESSADADFHSWRKRTKELRYQVELLASSGSPKLGDRAKSLAQLAKELGSVTDWIVLATALEERQERGSIPAEPELLEHIRRLVAERARELFERGLTVFSESPRTFARRILAERG